MTRTAKLQMKRTWRRSKKSRGATFTTKNQTMKQTCPSTSVTRLKKPLTGKGLSLIQNLNICSDYDGKWNNVKPALETQDPASVQGAKTNETDPLAKDEESNLAMDRDEPSRSLTGKH